MLLDPPAPKDVELEALASGIFARVAPELILEITSTLDIQDFLRLCRHCKRLWRLLPARLSTEKRPLKMDPSSRSTLDLLPSPCTMEKFLRRVRVTPLEETDGSGTVIRNVPRRNLPFEMVCCRFLQRLPSLRVLHFHNVNFDPVAVDSELFEALSIALKGVTDLSIDGDARGFPLHILANCSKIKTIELDLRCLVVNAAGTSPSKWLLEQYGPTASPTTLRLHHGDDVGLGRFGKIFTMQPAKFSLRMLRTLQLEYREIAPFTREDLARCRPGDFIPPVSWDGLSSTTKLAGIVLRNTGETLEKLVMMVELLDKGNSFVSTEDMAGICNLRALNVFLFVRPSYLGTKQPPKDCWLETLLESLPSTKKLEDLRIRYTVHLEANDDEEAVLRTIQTAMCRSLDPLLFGNGKFLHIGTFEFGINLFKKGETLTMDLPRHFMEFFPSIGTRGPDLDYSIDVTVHPFREV
ncbi:hypothetical protein NP233_g9467 [Leucocoprinus birnbaumii]|uniref:F-box domain-containing protein n=1 Tax=Leucocoprinus birnbaumii TaxID=56174 RepID=A0AAD5VM08_9AGAR|nr:hypothetical protein NP233_g9467 [Leucocoprinus birnbaumii]